MSPISSVIVLRIMRLNNINGICKSAGRGTRVCLMTNIERIVM